MKKILTIWLLTICTLIFDTRAQVKENLPWSWFGYTGFIGVDPSTKNSIGKQESLFSDYYPSLMFGFGGMYSVNNHFSLGPSVRFTSPEKEYYKLGIIGIGPIFQYNIVSITKRFSPYIFIEPNFSFIGINRYAHTIDISPSSSSSGITITSQKIDVSAASASATVFGLSSGLGIDLKISQRWRLFSEMAFNRHMTAKSNYFTDNFRNVTAFRYTDLVVGFRVNMVKMKTIEKSKNKVLAQIHKDSITKNSSITILGKLKGIQQTGDGISVLLVNQKGEVIQKVLSDKDGYFVFSKIDKEDYDVILETPNENITASAYVEEDESVLKLDKSEINKLKDKNKENAREVIIGTAMFKRDSIPAANMDVYLLNTKDELVAKTTTDKKGRFAYRDLPPSDYKVVFSSQYPSVKADVNYTLSDSDINIAAEDRNKGENLIIYGKVEPNGSNSSLSQEIVLLDKNGNVIKTTTSDKDGHFAFTKIPGMDYNVVINSEDHKLSVKADYQVTDPDLLIKEKELPKFKYNKISNDTTSKFLAQVVTGKVTAKTPETSVEDVSMLLIDGNGNIVEKTKTDKDGNFKFNKLSPADYHVLIENKNPNLKAEVFVPDDNTALLISKSDLDKFNYKKINNDTTSHSFTINGITRLTGTNEPVEDISVLLIDDKGNVVRREKTNKDGVFNFKHLDNANYQIRIESNNKNIKANFQVFDDQSDINIADKQNPAIAHMPDTLLGTMYYQKNVFELSAENKQKLDVLIKYLKANSKKVKLINLDSYGDDSGTDEFNLKLTQMRARAVYNYLTSKGINKKIIRQHPYGKALTLSNSQSVADPALNRKTDIKIIK